MKRILILKTLVMLFHKKPSKCGNDKWFLSYTLKLMKKMTKIRLIEKRYNLKNLQDVLLIILYGNKKTVWYRNFKVASFHLFEKSDVE